MKINWKCTKCGNHSDIFGCVIPGEKLYEDRSLPVSWDDILHKRCTKCKHIERPDVICNRCSSTYEFGQMGCTDCNVEIELVINLQNSLFTIREQIRREKRQKNDTVSLEDNCRELEGRLTKLGYHPCPQCHNEYVIEDICFQCKSDGQQEL